MPPDEVYKQGTFPNINNEKVTNCLDRSLSIGTGTGMNISVRSVAFVQTMTVQRPLTSVREAWINLTISVFWPAENSFRSSVFPILLRP